MDDLPAKLNYALALVVRFDRFFDVLIIVLSFAVFGLLIFGAAYFTLYLVLPFSIRRALEERRNPALAVLLGSIVIGIAIIVAGAIHKFQ